jgi:hypothetical protein
MVQNLYICDIFMTEILDYYLLLKYATTILTNTWFIFLKMNRDFQFIFQLSCYFVYLIVFVSCGFFFILYY